MASVNQEDCVFPAWAFRVRDHTKAGPTSGAAQTDYLFAGFDHGDLATARTPRR